jgi:sugar lactone lactonase YvrE
MRVTVFRESRSILGESLVADAASDPPAMLWCDITAGLVHRSPLDGAVDGSDDETIALPAPVASFHLADLGGRRGLVVSLGDRIVLAELDGTIERELAVVDHAHDGLRLNEGKVDLAGRWVTGSMDLTRDERDGAFYSLAPGGALRTVHDGVGTANGLEWSLDGSRVYFTDTAEQTVYTAAYDPEGTISEVDVFHEGEMHDGLTIDVDGTFWGAVYGGGVVVHYDADGLELERVELPAPNLTSVAFGPGGSRKLYVASARENLTEEDLQRHPLSGSVFAIETRTSGRHPRIFHAA